MDVETILESFIEVSLVNDFSVIAETLTRIGIADTKQKKLYQSCHILQKRGKFYIVHFKEMFLLDGKAATLSDNDRWRRNAVAYLLEKWGLIEILTNGEEIEDRAAQVYVLKAAERHEWSLVPKYTFTKRRKENET